NHTMHLHDSSDSSSAARATITGKWHTRAPLRRFAILAEELRDSLSEGDIFLAGGWRLGREWQVLQLIVLVNGGGWRVLQLQDGQPGRPEVVVADVELPQPVQERRFFREQAGAGQADLAPVQP